MVSEQPLSPSSSRGPSASQPPVCCYDTQDEEAPLSEATIARGRHRTEIILSLGCHVVPIRSDATPPPRLGGGCEKGSYQRIDMNPVNCNLSLLVSSLFSVGPCRIRVKKSHPGSIF